MCVLLCVVRAASPLNTSSTNNKQQKNKNKHKGPFSLPLLGDLLGMTRHGMHEYVALCAAKYGDVFKIYLGCVCCLSVCDWRGGD